MSRSKLAILSVLLLVAGCRYAAAQPAAGDSAKGDHLLHESCAGCHRPGSRLYAPDLSRKAARSLTTARAASRIWNNAPGLWKEGDPGHVAPAGSPADAFAYFASLRHFEQPADAKRGRRLFEDRGCAQCHGLRAGPPDGGPPAGSWKGLSDPVALAHALWQRSDIMHQQHAVRGLAYCRVTAQEMNDLLLYLANVIGRDLQPSLRLGLPEEGRKVFESKGCAACHTGKLALDGRIKQFSTSCLAAAIWNNTPRMAANRPPLSYAEAAALMGYVWSLEDQGRPARGARLWDRRCAGCHETPSAATRQTLAMAPAVEGVWSKAPSMHAAMLKKGLQWPRFSEREMADLDSYLRVSAGR